MERKLVKRKVMEAKEEQKLVGNCNPYLPTLDVSSNSILSFLVIRVVDYLTVQSLFALFIGSKQIMQNQLQKQRRSGILDTSVHWTVDSNFSFQPSAEEYIATLEKIEETHLNVLKHFPRIVQIVWNCLFACFFLFFFVHRWISRNGSGHIFLQL